MTPPPGSHGEVRWAAWLSADQRRLQDGDRYGLDHLIAAFGGMGLLSDLVLDPRTKVIRTTSTNAS